MKDIPSVFEHKVLKSFESLGIDLLKPCTLGVGVSGGADSISLLTCLARIIPSEKSKIIAVTVNHNIRPPEQTEGDALFVQEYCRTLGVECLRFDIPRGKVDSVSKERGGGLEEAARFLRYAEFEKVCETHKVDRFCLAHNLNDQTETLLMRFFSGAGTESLSGIPAQRGKFVRPLLNISRREIEEYLLVLGVKFRTDSTNASNSMLRNKMRNQIIPFLDKNITGWKEAALSLANKMKDDELFISSCLESSLNQIEWKAESNGSVSFSESEFKKLPQALQRRIIFKACDFVLSASKKTLRVPYSFVLRIQRNLQILPKIKGESSLWSENSFGMEVSCKNGVIFVEKKVQVATESGFFVIIDHEGTFCASEWTVSASKKERSLNLKVHSENDSVKECELELPFLDFPFAFRSRQSGDSIKTAEGGQKSVSKIMDGWKCGKQRDRIPLVQDLKACAQPLVCILGEPLGFNNWIVKEEK